MATRTYSVYGLFCACPKCQKETPGEIRYVGATINGVEARLSSHIRSSSRPADASWSTAKSRWMRSHGVGNIRAFLLDHFITSPQEATESEGYWISHLNTYRSERGLNLSVGGEGVTLRPPRTEEQVQRTAAKNRGSKRSAQTRAKLSEKAKRRVGLRTGGANGKVDGISVRNIKLQIWNGVSPSDIADSYRISRSQVGHISNNRAWTSIPWPIGPRRKPVRANPRKHSAETRAKMSESHLRRNRNG